MSERKYVKTFESFINENYKVNEGKNTIKFHFKKNENKVMLIGNQANKDSEFIKTLLDYLKDGGYFEGGQYTKNKKSKEPMTIFEFSGDKETIEDLLHKVAAVTEPTISDVFDKKDYGINESDTDQDLSVGDEVTVPKSLTTDPANKRGESGKIVKIDKDGTVHVKFHDGEIGKYADIEIFENSNINESDVEQSFSVGDQVMIDPDHDNYEDYLDNDNYKDYLDTELIVTDVYTDRKDHPGFDDSIGMALYDVKIKNGEKVPFSLYDFELVEV